MSAPYKDPEIVNGILVFKESKDVVFYTRDISSKITPEVRQLLEEYGQIPPDQVNSHVHTIRDKAWAIQAYPCTGLGLFLSPMINKSPAYPEILARLKDEANPATFLDIGTFIGQDLRALAFAGCPTTNLYATDIISHWQIGYSLFNDAERFHATFIESNILSPSPAFLALSKKIDIIYTNFVLHLFSWENQVKTLKQVVNLSKGKGSLFVGCQIGHLKAGNYGVRVWLHDRESWGRLWDEVGRETGTRWDAGEVEMKRWKDVGLGGEGGMEWMGIDSRMLVFVVRRIE